MPVDRSYYFFPDHLDSHTILAGFCVYEIRLLIPYYLDPFTRIIQKQGTRPDPAYIETIKGGIYPVFCCCPEDNPITCVFVTVFRKPRLNIYYKISERYFNTSYCPSLSHADMVISMQPKPP